jgi:leucyl-tRNA synthetase
MPDSTTTKIAPDVPDDAHPYRYTAQIAADIEGRWQSYWEDNATFATPNPGDDDFNSDRPKFYVLDMFPYPSGVGLHVGHPLGYIATDVLARYRRMCGFNVLHPMGFDAFGLPAEQFAVEHGVHPQTTTERNIANMVRQLKGLGLGYDWSRTLATTDSDYYRWTQWIFLQLYDSWYDTTARKARPIAELIQRLEADELRAGEEDELISPDTPGAPAWADLEPVEQSRILAQHRLAYMSQIAVNWCPALGTVLANEEVTNEGRSDRGNHPVFKRPLRQWMLRITAYAQRLLEDLDGLDWPEPIKHMQRNWIGSSDGALIDFAVDGADETIRVFTTRPDTLFGATYMVLAPEHPLVDRITTADHRSEVDSYREQAQRLSEIDRMAEGKTKTGVATGGHAINPASGERIPIWIADYVLMGYGTGAIMAVPSHDARDGLFAQQFQLPRRIVVEQPDGYQRGPDETSAEVFKGDGTAINSSNSEITLDGRSSDQAKLQMIQWLERKGLGRATVHYKLRDWLFSRQRYWGEPFPILHAPDGTIVAIDDSELPVLLPEMDDFTPETSDDPNAPPRPPLARAPESWRIVERDGVRYERELNTMPQWAGSCWYYLRFCDPNNAHELLGKEVERYWMNPSGVDLYIGGAEHAVLHLLYARFWHKVLFDLGHLSTPEPFGRLFNQGYIQAFAYRDERGMAVPADEVVDQDGASAFDVQDQPGRSFAWNGEPVVQEYGKMGKSLKNAVSPDDIREQYGCDTLRLYEMYMGPLDQSKPWNPRDIAGLFRFLQRVWRLTIDEQTGQLRCQPSADSKVEKALHHTIAKVGQDIERLAFNTAISAQIELVNIATQAGGLSEDQLQRLVRLLAPFAPYMAEELWAKLGQTTSVATADWPNHDPSLLEETELELPVQVMGKVRARITVPAEADEETVRAIAMADERIVACTQDRKIRKVIVVPGKIVNVVVG